MLCELQIRFTNVFGEILHFLSQIKTLETIIFLYNNFSGNLPLRLPLISNLYRVSFDGNRISATISNSFGSFSEPFKLITLSNNCLTRGILETLAKLVFDFVDLSQNMLVCDVSVLFRVSKTLEILDLSHNHLYGTLPEGLTSLKNLGFLDVSYNNLCGKTPRGGRLQKIDVSSYAHN
ncbi:hypothetical protein JHK85_013112 [Glycine max]|nr:hypothetical protein JHK85_013112 [Glycine max]